MAKKKEAKTLLEKIELARAHMLQCEVAHKAAEERFGYFVQPRDGWPGADDSPLAE